MGDSLLGAQAGGGERCAPRRLVECDREDAPLSVVFFDGVCGLCDRLVLFLLRRDPGGVLRFAPLQGDLARRSLLKHGLDPADLDSVVVVSNWSGPDERALIRSRAVLQTLDALGGGWRVLARTARIVPLPLADAIYRLVAHVRYKVFGRFDTCQLPRPEWQDRFIDGRPTGR